MAMLNKDTKGTDGFTLVELILVIVIIGILASITLIGFGRFQTDANDGRRASSAASIAEAVEKYYDVNGEYPGCQTMQAADITKTILNGLNATTILAPKALAGTVSSIKCGGAGNILSVDSPDFFEYTGDDSTDCKNGTTCLAFSLRYKEEGSDTIKTITSRRTVTFAVGDIALSSNTISFTSFNATWTPVQNVTAYVLQRATNSSFTAGVTDIPSTTPGAAVSGLTKGTTYYVRAKANNSTGQSTAWSNVITVTTLDISQPTITSVARTSTTKLTPTWTAAANATSYKLDYSSSNTFPAGSTDSTTVTGTSTATQVALQEGRDYYFRVTGLNGAVAGTASNTVSQYTNITAPNTPTISVATYQYAGFYYDVQPRWSPSGTCAANTTMVYQGKYNGTSGYSSDGWPWVDYDTSTSTTWSGFEGHTYSIIVQAACRSNSTTTRLSSWSAEQTGPSATIAMTPPTNLRWIATRDAPNNVTITPEFNCRFGGLKYGNSDPYIAGGWIWTDGPNSGNSGWYTPGGFKTYNDSPVMRFTTPSTKPFTNGTFFNGRAYISCRNSATGLQSTGSTVTGPGWTWGTNL